MIASFIYLLVVLAVLGLIYWCFLQFPLPDPIPRIARVIFTVICCLILISWLLSLLGTGPGFGWPGPQGHGIFWR